MLGKSLNQHKPSFFSHERSNLLHRIFVGVKCDNVSIATQMHRCRYTTNELIVGCILCRNVWQEEEGNDVSAKVVMVAEGM